MTPLFSVRCQCRLTTNRNHFSIVSSGYNEQDSRNRETVLRKGCRVEFWALYAALNGCTPAHRIENSPWGHQSRPTENVSGRRETRHRVDFKQGTQRWNVCILRHQGVEHQFGDCRSSTIYQWLHDGWWYRVSVGDVALQELWACGIFQRDSDGALKISSVTGGAKIRRICAPSRWTTHLAFLQPFRVILSVHLPQFNQRKARLRSRPLETLGRYSWPNTFHVL